MSTCVAAIRDVLIISQVEHCIRYNVNTISLGAVRCHGYYFKVHLSKGEGQEKPCLD